VAKSGWSAGGGDRAVKSNPAAIGRALPMKHLRPLRALTQQPGDGIGKAHAMHGHDHLDGIEVFFAAEAAGKVGGFVDAGVMAVAKRAGKALGAGGRGDYRRDGDVIAKIAQLVGGPSAHGFGPRRESPSMVMVTQ